MFGRILCVASATLAIAAPAAADIGRVKRTVGAVSIERGARKIAPTPGFVLERSDILSTGPDGRISITFADNTRFSAGPGSRVILSNFAFDKSTHKGVFETEVKRGSLAIVSGQIAHENPNAMKVKTPTSLLGVRGTRFIVTVK